MSLSPLPSRRASAVHGVRRAVLVALALFGLILTTALPSAAQFGKNRIQYRDFDWQLYHSPHFDVYHYKAEEHQLQLAVSLAESAYDELSRRFDYQIQEPTPLIIYQTHSAFLQNNIILNGVPEGAQAFATPGRFRMVLPLDLPDNELLALIKHELTHIFQYHILFRGRLGGGLRGAPPQWFMEGGASYFANDETAADRKYMVDLVVNDNIPSVMTQGGGFLAYRFGHAVFDFIEERWGDEAVIDLVYEFRNTLGARVGKAIERTFRMDVEDFDTEFRRWARKKYLPALLETGEPGDFGRPFRLEPNRPQGGQEISPVASPSGDLVAAFTTDKGEVDISLFDTQRRRRIRNLTKGLDKEIREFVAQSFTTGRSLGSDLAFSPDGNYLAVFGRREAGRSLVLIDVLNGGLRKVIDMEIEQQLSPAWSPDGRLIAFSGNLNGNFDIFVLDLETNEVANVTDDEVFDAAPSFSPDGRWLGYTSFVGEYAQLFRLDLSAPDQRYQLTSGEHNNKEGVFSLDGERIYFSSDRTGADNIYGIDLAKGEVRQYTNALTACDQPTVLPLPEGGERLVYSGYWKRSFDLYMTDVEEPIGEAERVEIAEEPVEMAELERFEPDIEVSIDEDNFGPYRGKKFFIEDIQQLFGLDTNQVFVGTIFVSLSDYLGDRRILGQVSAVDSISDFQVTYANLSNRWQWSGTLSNTRLYTFFREQGTNEVQRRKIYSLLGATFNLTYPFSTKNRVEFSGGFYQREYKGSFSFDRDPFDDIPAVPVITPRQDEYPEFGVSFVSDSTIYGQGGPLSGHRLRVGVSWAPDLDESGTLTSNIAFDARKYLPVTRRVNFAFRLAGAASEGNFPTPFFVGGLDQIRGLDFRELGGFRTFYANAELRFPLIDQLRFPGFALGGIRGVLFFDIGAAWFPEVQDFDLIQDGRLVDAIASYGYGFTVNLLGFQLNWDFAKLTNLENSEDGFQSAFWIGRRF